MKLENLFTTPTFLTLIRLPLGIAGLGSLLEGRYKSALVLLILAGLSDVLDGWLARKLKEETLEGKILDPVIDKLLAFLFLIFFASKYISWIFIGLYILGELYTGFIVLLYVLATKEMVPISEFGKLRAICFVISIVFLMIGESQGKEDFIDWGRAFFGLMFLNFIIASFGYYIPYIKMHFPDPPE